MKTLFLALVITAASAFGQSVFPPAGGGVGVGAVNATATCAGTTTSCAVTITSLNLTSLNPALIQCKTATALVSITGFSSTGTNPINTVTPTYTSTVGPVICTVNSNGGAGVAGATGPAGPAPAGTGPVVVSSGVPSAVSTLPRNLGGLNSGSPGTGFLRDGTTPTAAELSGDVTTAGSGAATVRGLNGVAMSSLGAGIVKVDGSGVPSKASPLADYQSHVVYSTADYGNSYNSTVAAAGASTSNITIRLVGTATCTSATTLTGTNQSIEGPGTITQSFNGTCITLSGTNQTIRGITLTTSGTGTPVNLSGATNPQVLNSNISGYTTPDVGIGCDHVSPAKIMGNKLVGTGSGIYCQDGLNNLEIAGNTIDDTGATPGNTLGLGIHTSGADATATNINVHDNYFINAGGDFFIEVGAFGGARPQYITVRNNNQKATAGGTAGISISNADHVVVDGNQMDFNGQTVNLGGVEMIGDDIKATNNTMINPANSTGVGISCDGCTNSLIKGNKVPGLIQLTTSNGARLSVSGNVVDSNTINLPAGSGFTNGILLFGNVSGCTITGNVVQNNNITGNSLVNGNTATYEFNVGTCALVGGNVFANNTATNIQYFYDHSGTVTGTYLMNNHYGSGVTAVGTNGSAPIANRMDIAVSDVSSVPVTKPAFKDTMAHITASNCDQGQIAFASDATAGANLYLCTSTNTWTQVTGGGGGGTGASPYTATVTAATSITVTAATHGQGTAPVAQCFDSSGVVNACSITINPSTGDVSATWPTAFTGTLRIIGGGTGATSFGALSTLAATRTDSTHLAIGAGACGFAASTTAVASTTATISGGTGTAFLYCASNGTLTLGHNLTVSCSGGATCAGSITSIPVDAVPLASCTATSGTWDSGGCSDLRTPFRREVLVAGANITLTQTGSGTTIAAAAGGGSATSWYDVFDGSTTALQDGTSVTWTTSGLTKTATWTVPAGVNQVRVQAWSGGSGGGASGAGDRTGGGGMGGGFVDTTCPVTPSGTVSIVVGLGGAGATGNGFSSSTAGGATSFGSCFALTGGTSVSGGSGAGWAGYLSSIGNIFGWVNSGNQLVTSTTNCTLSNTPGSNSWRTDGGGCGAALIGASSTGLAGGSAVFGGGGGGSGGYGASNTGGAGGTSQFGGAGGAGGNGGASTCTNGSAGTIPGGGGGSAGVAAATANCNGGAGARGEIRVSYAK